LDGYEVDLDTGKELYQPVPMRVRIFPVSVHDGRVYVTV